MCLRVSKRMIPVVTTQEVPGRRNAAFKGLVWASKKVSVSLIANAQNVLSEAKAKIAAELASQAERVGADAVVAARIEIVARNASDFYAYAYGTAVKTKK